MDMQYSSRATAQSPSQLLPRTSGVQKQSATEDLIVAAVGD